MNGIRDARHEDISQLAALHQSVFSGTMGASLGAPYLHRFFGWYIGNPQAINLAYEASGRLSGYVFGAPDGHGARLNRELLPTIVRSLITHPEVFAHSNFLRAIPARLLALAGRARAVPVSSVDSRIFALVGIGVSSAERGSGIGRRLMAAYRARVWDAGFEKLVLHVYRDNARARRLYESCGWTLTDRRGAVLTYMTEQSGPHAELA